jgi:AsmA protein
VRGDLAGVPLDRQVASAVRRSPQGVAVGRLSIVDGFITYDNAESGASSELSAVNLNITWRSRSEQALATGTMVWRGETVEMTGSLARPPDFFAGRSSPATLAIRSTPLRLSFQGSAYAAGEMGLDGDLRITTPSLRHALEWIGRGIGDGPTLGTASITAKAKVTGTSITFSDATIALDGNEAAGGVTVALGGERPRFQGTLAFKTLDISPYMESFRAGLAGSRDWNPAAINLPVLRDTDLDFRLSAQQVAIGGARIGPAAASAVGTGGHVSVDIGDLQIYGGSLKATLTADLTDPVVAVMVRADLRDVPTRAALANLAGVDAIDGTGSAAVDVSGRAESWNALLRSAAGSVSIKLVNCSIAGFDISQLGEDQPKGSGGQESAAHSVTTFDSIAGTLLLGDATIHAADIVAEGRDYAVMLDGTASLLTPTIKGHGTITIRKPVQQAARAGGLEIPFVIGGSWLQPMISLDVDRMLLQKDTKPASITGGRANRSITARVP